MHLHIATYHYVRNLAKSRYPTIKGLDTKLFQQQLEFFAANFTIVRMEDVLAAIDGYPLPENAILLTFDDGYIDHYNVVFPILDKMGVQGSFFPPVCALHGKTLLDVNKIHFTLASGNESQLYISLINEIDSFRGIEFDIPNTKSLLEDYAIPNRFDSKEIIFIKRMLQTVLPVKLRALIADKLFKEFVGVDETVFAKELYCDTKQITTMKRHGMFIGLHGYGHEWLGNLDKCEYEDEINKALNFMDIAGLIDKKAWVMSYPYGSWSEGLVEFLRANGCKIGLTTEVNIADLSSNESLLLPRLDTNDFPPKSDNYLKHKCQK